MGLITIQRESALFNRSRDYEIYIDDLSFGVISNGETKILRVANGVHKTTVKSGWCSSSDYLFYSNPNNPINLKVQRSKAAVWVAPMILAFCLAIFILKTYMDTNIILTLVVPVLILLVYYFTLGRKRYFILTEV